MELYLGDFRADNTAISPDRQDGSAHAGLTPEKILHFHQEAEKLEAARLATEQEKEAEQQRLALRMR